jgi:hypothetical protein
VNLSVQNCDDKLINRARRHLVVPAIGLMLSAVVNVLYSLVVTVSIISKDAGDPNRTLFTALFFISIPMAAFVVFGAARMMQARNYGISVAAVICAIVITLPAPGIISYAFAIWSVIVLSLRNVRHAFASNSSCQSVMSREVLWGNVAFAVLMHGVNEAGTAM